MILCFFTFDLRLGRLTLYTYLHLQCPVGYLYLSWSSVVIFCFMTVFVRHYRLLSLNSR